MNIRLMKFEDLERVAILAGQLGYQVTLSEVQLRFREMLELHDTALFVAENENGDVIGWIQVNRCLATLLDESRAEITALVVDSACRSQGIGKTLLAHAESWALQHGLPKIRLRSNIKREDAHRFYIREGYVISKTSYVFARRLVSNAVTVPDTASQPAPQ